MFDIVFKTVSEPFNGNNILLACFAGNLTIFAFGFPYIYRAISNLSRVSVILTNRIKNKRLRKFYPWFLIHIFIFNAISLIWSDLVIISILSVIFLLVHIVYVMNLYQMIENVIMNPFTEVVNKDINKENAKFKNIDEIENDIIFVTDLIYYSENNNLNEYKFSDFFSWLIDVTFLKFKEYDSSKLVDFWGLLSKEYEKLYSTLLKIQWLNLWAVNEKKLVTLDCIDNFYLWVLEYGTSHPDNFYYDAHPILKTINNINNLKDYKQRNLMEQIQNAILEQKEQTSLYRANNGCISINEEYYFVELLYYILSRKFKIKQSTKYEPCFNIIAGMIDNNVLDKHYQKIIKRIQKHHDYFYGKDSIYSDICGFHINIMAYLIFKNQFQLLKSYMYYEEPNERSSQHTRPQIPNTINNILGNFIGNNSVFYNTQTFSANTSSYKYKFYMLFILLIYSKNFGEKYKKTLAKLNKNDWQYEYIEKDLKAHCECSIDFKSINFDDLMSFISIENYRDFIDKFSKEFELLNLFEYQEEDVNFVKQILDSTIIEIKNAQNELLEEKFQNVALRDFSLYKQSELKVKNLEELIHSKMDALLQTIKGMRFSCSSDFDFQSHDLILYDKIHNKKQLLSGHYEYLFNSEPSKDFYHRLFNLLIENCHRVSSIDDLPSNTGSDYQILSNFERRQVFVSFGFKKEDIKVKTCNVNGKQDDDYEFANVASVKIRDTNIMVSEYNNNFYFLNDNGTYPYTIILLNPNKISIEFGKEETLKYIDIKDENVEILDNTQIKIKLPKDKSLGYCIVKEQNTQN